MIFRFHKVRNIDIEPQNARDINRERALRPRWQIVSAVCNIFKCKLIRPDIFPHLGRPTRIYTHFFLNKEHCSQFTTEILYSLETLSVARKVCLSLEQFMRNIILFIHFFSGH